MFELQDGKLVLTNVPVPEPARWQDLLLSSANQGLFKKVKVWLDKNTRLYGALRKLKPGPVPMEKEMGVWKKQYDDDTRQAWVITEALLVKLKEETKASNANLIVF